MASPALKAPLSSSPRCSLLDSAPLVIAHSSSFSFPGALSDDEIDSLFPDSSPSVPAPFLSFPSSPLYLRVPVSGTSIGLYRPPPPPDPDTLGRGVTGVLRSVVTGLSSAARRRLSADVSLVDSSAPALFVTLTFPGNPQHWSSECFRYGPPLPLPGPREAKYILHDVFLRRCERRFPGLSAHVKLEPQERGVPHFHLLLYGPFLAADGSVPVDLAQYMVRTWHKLVGRGQADHLRYGCQIDPLTSTDARARIYLTKYVSKDEVLPLLPDHGRFAGMSPGNFWGRFNRSAIPYSPIMEFDVSPEFGAVVKRLFMRFVSSKARCGFRAYRARLISRFMAGLKVDLDALSSSTLRGLYKHSRRSGFPSGRRFLDPTRFGFTGRVYVNDPMSFVRRIMDLYGVGAIVPRSSDPPSSLAGPVGRLP